jgi:hypothetical protein
MTLCLAVLSRVSLGDIAKFRGGAVPGPSVERYSQLRNQRWETHN